MKNILFSLGFYWNDEWSLQSNNRNPNLVDLFEMTTGNQDIL